MDPHIFLSTEAQKAKDHQTYLWNRVRLISTKHFRIFSFFFLALSISAISIAVRSNSIPTIDLRQTYAAVGISETFQEHFDGNPSQPAPFTQTGQNMWDVQIHSRNIDTWDTLAPFEIHHGSNCEPPLTANAIVPYDSNELMVHDMTGDYETSVFKCADHVMTGINGIGKSINDGYGLVVLTPDHMVDFSQGDATIKFSISTYRTTPRDWIDIWITPYDENLALPFDSSNFGVVDLQGTPLTAVQIGMFAPNDNSKSGFRPAVFKNGVNTNEFKMFSNDFNWYTGYEDYLPGKAGDPKRRDTFEITISKNHLKVCMPKDITDNSPSQTICWADKSIAELPFTKGIVQFAHHSYTPNKDCNLYSPLTCGPNTWHWDDIEISPSIGFSMIKSNVRIVKDESIPVIFEKPAPENSYLRFSAAGNVSVSFEEGSFQQVAKQPSSNPNSAHAASYFIPISTGTNEVRFKLTENGAGGVHAKDFAIWTETSSEVPTPTINPSLTSTPGAINPTATPPSTPTPQPGISVNPTSVPTLIPTSIPEPTPTPPTESNLFVGSFFADINSTNPKLTTLACQNIKKGTLNFNWGSFVPTDCPQVGKDYFSDRWIGVFNFPKKGTYRFKAQYDDAIRVWIDRKLNPTPIIDKWSGGGILSKFLGTNVDVILDSGNHTIEVEHYETTNQAGLKFNWNFLK